MANGSGDASESVSESGDETSELMRCCAKKCAVNVCVHCFAIYHKSCSDRNKKVKYIGDNKVICCVASENGGDEGMADNTRKEVNTLLGENELLRRIIKEMSDKNSLLSENKKLIEEKLEYYKHEMKRLQQAVQKSQTSSAGKQNPPVSYSGILTNQSQNVRSTERVAKAIIDQKVSSTKINEINVSVNQPIQQKQNAKFIKPPILSNSLTGPKITEVIEVDQLPAENDCSENVNNNKRNHPYNVQTEESSREILERKQLEKMRELIYLNEQNTIGNPVGDREGFQTVRYRKGRRQKSVGEQSSRQDKTRFNITVGTRAIEENDLFRARPSKMWLYIGKINEGVVEETVEKYIRDKVPALKPSDLVVDKLPTVGRSPSFKVGIDNKHYDELKAADFWPSGIIVRRYNFRVSNYKQSIEGALEQTKESTQDFLG